MTDEIYKRYEDTNFWISNYGNVYNTQSKRLSQGTWDKTTHYFKLYINKKIKRVHRLVFELFAEDPNFSINNPEMQIDHIDGHRDNNHITNLRKVTRKENLNNRHKGLHPVSESLKKTLKKHYQNNKEKLNKYQREYYHTNKK